MDKITEEMDMSDMMDENSFPSSHSSINSGQSRTFVKVAGISNTYGNKAYVYMITL